MRAAFHVLSPIFPASSSIGPRLLPFRRPVLLCGADMGSVRSISRGGNAGEEDHGVLDFLESLKNYEKLGVPKGAGTDSTDGFDLARMHRLLVSLGDPLAKYPVIHIAGTKGKGSTATFISNILRTQGYNVGSYTSPHIRSIHERIVAGKTGDPITPSSFQRLFEDNRNIIEAAVSAELGSLTHFEILTALAFQYFTAINVDIAVVEAGLGGARDATNVISPSGLAVAVITNIGKEHLEALGGSIESIALAKAGIIKQGRPVVLGGPLDAPIEKIICEVASSKNASVVRAFGDGMYYKVGDVKLKDNGVVQCCDISIDSTAQGLAPTWKLERNCLELQMMGVHQLDNALTAICTVLCLRNEGWRVDDNAIWSGLEQTVVAGRFHTIPNPKIPGLGKSTLVLDGAHTADSAKALASTLKMVFPSESLAFVIAMASDKDHYEFCSRLLTGTIPKVVVSTESLVAGGRFRSTPPTTLAKACEQAAKDRDLGVTALHSEGEIGTPLPDSAIIVTSSSSILSSLEKASRLLSVGSRGGVVCVTGSLHAVSEVLSLLHTKLPCKA